MSASRDAIEAALERARNGASFEFYRLAAEPDAERAKRLDAERAEPEAAFSERLGAAIELESHTRGLTRAVVENNEFPTDHAYTPPGPDTPEFEQLAEGVPAAYWPPLANARSRAHAEFIKSSIRDEVDAMDKLARAGWQGTALRIGMAVLDPVSLSAILLTGGASFLMNGSRIARAGKLAAVAGAENVALEATLLGTRETKDVEDLYVALIGGVVAGGALGSILPAAKGAATAGDLKKMYEIGKRLTDGEAANTKVADSIAKDLDESLSVGAAQASRGVRELLTDQPSAEILNAPKLTGVEAKLRRGWFAELAKSDNPFVRYLGRKLLQDPVGTRGVAQEAAAEEFASVLKRRAMTHFWREANPGLGDYLRGVPRGERVETTNRFFEDVTEALRTQNFEGPAGRAAKGMMQAIRDVAEEAKRLGVKGFEDLDLDEGYVTRMWSNQKIERLLADRGFGSEQIERLVATAFSRGADVSEKIALRVARGIIHNVRIRGAGAITDFRIAVADRDTLASMMRAAGVGEDEIAEVTAALKGFGEKDTTKAGKIARAKRRLDLDESTVLKLKDRDGKLVPVGITDLFENDARLLTQMYVNSVGGHAAMARAGVPSPGDWEKIIRNARLYAQDRLGADSEVVNREIQKLEMSYAGLTGRPLIDYTDPKAALGLTARDWAYIAQSGWFGVAQASELMAVLTTGGFRLIAESVPALKGMFKRARDGQLTDDFAAEAEDIWSPGTEALLHSTVSRFEGSYDEALIPRGTSSILDRTERVRHGLRKVAGYASGMTPINIFMQRLGLRYVAQRVVNTAFGRGRGFSETRLRAMGLDEGMQKRVFEQIKTHVAMQRVGNREVPRLDIASWTDLDARDAFVLGVQREQGRSVLVPIMGAQVPWVAHSETGKVLTQFLTFAIQAHERILLHGVKHMDAERFVAWSLGTALAGMAYVGRTHIESIGRKDRKKFLRERLSTERIAAAAFNMSGFSALLPPVIDTALWALPGADPVFTHARTSGLGTNLLDFTNYPAGAMAGGVLNAVGVMSDGQFTASEGRQIARLVPFARAFGFQQAINALVSELPER